jgi:hypothetical protein
MLKKPASFVLDSSKSSTYPRGYASGFDSPAALLTAFLSILRFLLQLHNYIKCQRCVRLSFSRSLKSVRVIADRTNDGGSWR